MREMLDLLSAAVKRSLRKTEKVITISQNAQREIIEFYKILPKDVAIATPATDPKLFYRRSKEEIETVKRKYCISGDYILALSNLEPRKNLDALVDAYCDLPEHYRKNTSLLLVGVSGWKTDQLFNKIIERVKDGYSIIRPTSYVSDEDKPAIISGSKMLVYPSHYEGFGMPPLEALACGTPVITADNSSLPEVVGAAGSMIPSTDYAALLDSMVHYLNESSKLTKDAIKNGPGRAELFSWKKSGQVFLDVAKEIN